MKNEYLIGQRVIVEREIGVVQKSELGDPTDSIRVFLPSRGYTPCFDPKNVKPLPGGQL